MNDTTMTAFVSVPGLRLSRPKLSPSFVGGLA